LHPDGLSGLDAELDGTTGEFGGLIEILVDPRRRNVITRIGLHRQSLRPTGRYLSRQGSGPTVDVVAIPVGCGAGRLRRGGVELLGRPQRARPGRIIVVRVLAVQYQTSGLSCAGGGLRRSRISR
jgi:hypothetical protein